MCIRDSFKLVWNGNSAREETPPNKFEGATQPPDFAVVYLSG